MRSFYLASLLSAFIRSTMENVLLSWIPSCVKGVCFGTSAGVWFRLQTRWGNGSLVVAWESCYYGDMIQAFKNAGTEDIFNGENTKAARKVCPGSIWKIAARKLDQIDSVTALSELKILPHNKLEALSGGRKGQHSIRINDQYRICFVWTESGPDQVEIVDYH